MSMRTIACVLLLLAQATALSGGEQDRAGAEWTSTSFVSDKWPTGANERANALVEQAQQMLNARPADLDPVRAVLEEAVRLEPNHPKAWWRLGSVQFRPGPGYERGLANLLHQIEVAPSLAAYENVAFILQLSRAYYDALQVWQEAVERYPDEVEVRSLFGECLLAARRADAAIPVLSAARERWPGSSRVALDLGRALLRVDDRDAALPHLLAAAELEPSADMLQRVAGELLNAGRRDLALDHARRGWDAAADVLPGPDFDVRPLTPRAQAQAERLTATAALLWQTLGRTLGDVDGDAARAYAEAATLATSRADATGSPSGPKLQLTLPRPPGIPDSSGELLIVVDGAGTLVDSNVDLFRTEFPDLKQRLAELTFGSSLPDHADVRFLRRATIGCFSPAETCTLRMVPATRSYLHLE